MIELTPRLKLIACAVIALVVGFLVGTFVLTVPSPRVIGLEKTNLGISLHGVTSRGATVLVFGTDGTLLDITSASASGQFTIEALAPATGTHEVLLRALNSGWRASPPKRVDLAAVMAGEVQTSQSATTTTDDDLPPPAIPPTSTKPTVAPTSTPAVIESISAFAGVKSASLQPKATQVVTVTLKDQDGKLVPGANIEVVAHYPTEDVTYTATGDGSYRANFKVPENIGSGTVVILDVTATYEEFHSTARASFTVK